MGCMSEMEEMQMSTELAYTLDSSVGESDAFGEDEVAKAGGIRDDSCDSIVREECEASEVELTEMGKGLGNMERG